MQVSFEQFNVHKSGYICKNWDELSMLDQDGFDSKSLAGDSMIIRKVEDQIQGLWEHYRNKHLNMMMSEELEQKTIEKAIQKAICCLRSHIGSSHILSYFSAICSVFILLSNSISPQNFGCTCSRFLREEKRCFMSYH